MPSASLSSLQKTTRTYGPIKILNCDDSKLRPKQLEELYNVHHSELVVDIRYRELFGLWVYRVNVLATMPTCFAF